VRVPKTAELIARSLRRQIIRGELAPDDALPSETALMEHFGVSRPSLREAFRVLESEGLITVRRGALGGARVSAPDPEVAVRYAGLVLEYRGTTVGDVHAAAAMLESGCVRALAGRHTAADLKRLTTALAEEEQALGDPDALFEAEEAFHALLIELTRNQTLALLGEMVRGVIGRTGLANPSPGHDAARARRVHRTHAKLVALIAQGRADEAEKLWTRHLNAAEDELSGAADRAAVLDILD
jgi:DNA-binding FadR family transcriptional regulator